jgi:hypothetical protein
VSCRVAAQLGDGLRLAFLSFFHGTVDPFHLGPGQLVEAAGPWGGGIPTPSRATASGSRQVDRVGCRLFRLGSCAGSLQLLGAGGY